MLKSFVAISFIAAVTVGVCSHWVGICSAQSPEHRESASFATREDSLKRFLQDYVRERRLDDDKTTRYDYAFVDLNEDKEDEVIVYLMGRWWCGSGGCPTLILARKDSSYRVVTKVTITRPPIRVLTESSNGWRSIGVWVQGGGIQPGYEAELRFNGKTYPSNPSVAPARRLTTKVPGEFVIPSSQHGTALYP